MRLPRFPARQVELPVPLVVAAPAEVHRELAHLVAASPAEEHREPAYLVALEFPVIAGAELSGTWI